MKMAACGPPCGPDPRDHLPNVNGIARLHGDGFQVVVGCDEAVAVVNFHPVSAAPGVPARGAHHPGIGRIHPGAARGRIVLAQMEVAGGSRQRADPEAKG